MLGHERINKWFEEYQSDCDRDDMAELYYKLINEEIWELKTAIMKWDIIEIYDAIWDIAWVAQWYVYFWWCSQIILQEAKIYMNLLDINILYELLDVIADSNFTKTKEKQTEWWKIGKIKKWENYKPPKIREFLISKWIISFKN